MRILLVTALTPAVWGTTYAVTTEFLPPGRPLLSGLLRALPAGLLLLAITRELPKGAWWWKSAVLGALNIGIFFALLFVTAYRLPGGMAAVLGAVQPLLVAGLSVLLLAERVAVRTVLAGVLGAAGVGLAVLTASARLDAIGVVAGLAGAASMAFGLVLTKRWGRPAVSLLTATGWQLTAGGLLLIPITLMVEGVPGSLSATNLAGYAYLSLIGTALAYTIWFRGLERLPASRVSLLAQLSPVTATLVGWAALGQSLTPVQLAGMVLAAGAVMWGQSTHVRAGHHPVREAGASGAQHGPADRVGGGHVLRDHASQDRQERRGEGVGGVVPAGLRSDAVGRLDEAGAEGVAVREERHDLVLGAALDPGPHEPAVRVGAGSGDVDEGEVRVQPRQRTGGRHREVVGDPGVSGLVHADRGDAEAVETGVVTR
ncbi:DMT family transporter [Actinoplanes sp. NEAU-A11]|uniref:DMT family transporter n=1 Tax=Actinoplanes aureus TaxID=2792083 RepID=A0A931C4U8_9ACTN|nr:DMT family transporter [Actinoplanes aureus]